MTTYIKIGFVDTKDELLRVYEALVSTNTSLIGVKYSVIFYYLCITFLFSLW
jgi:hypothetical protein